MITIPQDSADLESMVAEATNAYLERAEGGDAVDLEEFIRAYPRIADILRKLLPAMRAMQKPPSTRPGGPQTTPDTITDSTGRLGDFRLIREIGRGGMGVVYEAEQLTLNRHVALKVLPLAAALDPRHLQRFKVEAQAAACLNHPHIVPIFDSGSERGVYYYAMQFIEGHSLAEIIFQPLKLHQDEAPVVAPPTVIVEGNGQQPEEHTSGEIRQAHARTLPFIQTRSYFHRAATIGVQVAEALDYAHGMGVVHRDVKPANLLLDAQGKVYVTDFGLAQLRGVSGLTMTGDLVGTLRYMSPEQVAARRGLVDHRTDVYALGATLYEMLTLAPAFDGTDRAVLLRQIADEEPVPPRHRNPALPVDLETIVLKAMAKEPEKRYATAQELADDLKRFLEDRPIEARRPTLLERATRWGRRHSRMVATAVVLLAVAAVSFAVGFEVIRREQNKTKKALVDKEVALVAEKEARQKEETQRKRADQLGRLARNGVNRFFTLCENELADKPNLLGLRRKVLEEVLGYYQNFIKECDNDLSLHDELAATHLSVAMIFKEIGSRSEALASLDRAREVGEKLVRDHPTAPEYQTTLSSIYDSFGSIQDGPEFALLSQPAIQTELKLTPEQAERIVQMNARRLEGFGKTRYLNAEEWRARFEELSTREKALIEVLDKEQAKRLRQIITQQRGVDLFNDPAVSGALQLTPEQLARIRAIQEVGTRPGPIFTPQAMKTQNAGRPLTPQERALAVLTPEQRARWNEMTGMPFQVVNRPTPDQEMERQVLRNGVRALETRSQQNAQEQGNR